MTKHAALLLEHRVGADALGAHLTVKKKGISI